MEFRDVEDEIGYRGLRKLRDVGMRKIGDSVRRMRGAFGTHEH